jgi:biotin carboxyl carrier protein
MHDVEVEREGEAYSVNVDGERHDIELVGVDGAVASLRFPSSGRNLRITYHQGANGSWRITVGQREFDLEVLTPAEAVQAKSTAGDSGPSRLTAPIPGKVVAVKIDVGDVVEPGQALIVLEAMKMENELAADQSAKVAAIHVAAGDTVEGGELLVELE